VNRQECTKCGGTGIIANPIDEEEKECAFCKEKGQDKQ
jgi:RecJ-like exonuclease